jgi:hypothetical protein
LDEAGIRHEHHVAVGPAAETIVGHAKGGNATVSSWRHAESGRPRIWCWARLR